MNKIELFRELKEEFIGDLMEFIIPGALHNFANPLNGITGRIKLLEMHLAKFIQTVEPTCPEMINDPSLDKIKRDVFILTEESDKFLALFRNFEGKILTLASDEQQMINIPELIRAEVAFADCYLDFKHNIGKTLKIDEKAPPVLGDRAAYSFCFSTLLNCARLRMKNDLEKKLAITVGVENDDVKIVIEDSGEAISEVCKKMVAGSDLTLGKDVLPDRSCCLSFLLLKMHGFRIHIETGRAMNVVSLSKSYRDTS
jgi:signal transduction histidine kinase